MDVRSYEKNKTLNNDESEDIQNTKKINLRAIGLEAIDIEYL